jgi:hypothetical protein
MSGAGAAAVVGGAGFALGTRGKNEAITKVYERLSRRIEALEPEIDELGDMAIAVTSESLQIHEAATDYGDRYPALRDALESWNRTLGKMGVEYESMREIEGGIKMVTRFLAQIARLLHAEVKLPFGLSMEFADAESLGEALTSASDVLESLPDALDACGELRCELTHWVSDNPDIDVDHRLLRPLEESFCLRVKDLASKCWTFERDWDTELVQPLEDVSETSS